MKVKTKKSTKKFTSGILVTFTPTQKEAIEKYADSKGLSTASFIRFQVLKEVLESKETLTYGNHPLTKFAGKLGDEVAQKMLIDVSESRVNKE